MNQGVHENLKLSARKTLLYCCFVVFLAVHLFVVPEGLRAETILKVGVYNNKPTIFIDKDGIAGGVFIDILENIAEREDWKLDYVSGHFSELMSGLQAGTIDLLPAVAYSEKREAVIDFNLTTVMANWAELYTAKGQGIASFQDLEGKIVAVKQGDIHFLALKEMVDNFNISCRFFETDEYQTVFEMLQASYTQVGVVNRLYGSQQKDFYGVEATPIIYNPIEMRYAVPEGRNQEILTKLDTYLPAFKEDENSVYNKSVNRWLFVDNKLKLPEWISQLFYTVAIGSILLLMLTLLSRYQVRKKTRELRLSNEQLQEQIQKEKQAEEKTRKIARVVEAASDAVALLDRRHRHLFSNSAYRQLTGISQDEPENRTLPDLLGTSLFKNDLETPISQCLRGRTTRVQAVCKELFGDARSWNVTLSPYYSEDEKIVGYVIAIRDMTEQVALENSLKTAQKMEAIGTMASGVAHDLNNILAGIVSYPELLRSKIPPDSELKGPLQTIENAGKRAAAVVGDLLTLARNAASVKEAVDVNELITELLGSPEWLTIARQHPQVDLKTNLDADNAVVVCSQVHVRKCLLNLMHNGFEAASPGGRVLLSTCNSAKAISLSAINDKFSNSRDLLIRVVDSGPGIAPEHIDYIFEPFYTTKKLGRSGSGLGLAVVWSTVEEHGGRVRVENVDPGAMFEIRLPLAHRSIKAEKLVDVTDIQKYGGEGKLLIVDDEPELREITSGIVQLLGYSAATVASGEEALARLDEHDYDLVLLDMILKDGISGYETYKKILERKPNQKAVIISGYSNSDDVKKALDLGASSIIKKPYTVAELGKAITHSLQQDA